jgi:hypothetical protein
MSDMPLQTPAPFVAQIVAEIVAPIAACTIVSPNYLAYARTVATSYLAQHPGHRFFVLLVADLADSAPFANEPFEAVLLPEIGVQSLRAVAMRFEILELNTNVKPTFLKYLLTRYQLDKVTYLDPDIFVYSPLAPVFDALESADCVLTPHLTSPITDDKLPGEQEMLYNGTFNLGFAAFRNTPNSLAILAWWEHRCLHLGFSEGRTGLFVDQKWMNLAPGLFEDVAILRHPGCNMAYWNLNDRTLSGDATAPTVNQAVPLVFFHFSGIVLDDPAMLSKNTDRFTLATRPDLADLFAFYKANVLANKDPTLEALPYGFDSFPDGTTITRLARRLYARHEPHFGTADPFDVHGPFFHFAHTSGLLAGKALPQKATWREFSGTDRRVEAVHALLKLALRLLGPNRYELLMRYLSHISVLRNQSVFLKPKGSNALATPGL